MNRSGFHLAMRGGRFSPRQHGSALVEYTIVVLFLIVVLVAGDYTGTTHYLADKVREAYASFVYALSISWI